MAIEGRSIQSIEVGGRILQVLVDAEQPMMLRDIARQADLPPAQVHAYLVSYREQKLVEQNANGGRYRLGPFALLLGIARMRSFDPLRMAGDSLADLVSETGFTVALTIWGTHGPTVIQIHEGVDQLYTKTRAGTVYSVSGTATGRVFAAFLPERIIKAAVELENSEGAKSRRVGPPASFKSLREPIQLIRKQGYGTIDPTPVPGVTPLSAPVFDHVGQIQMAITIIGPTTALDTSPSSPVVLQLLAFTRRLSARLGYEGAENFRTEPGTIKRHTRSRGGADGANSQPHLLR